MFGIHRSQVVGVAAALALAGVTTACGDDGEGPARGQPAVRTSPVAAQPVSAVPVSDVAPVEPVEPTVPASVTYADAESVFHARRYADAAEMFGVYTNTHPDNGWGHYMLGLSAWKAGDAEQAIAALERAIELDSTNVKAHTNLGRVLLEQGRAEEALAQMEAARTLDPQSGAVLRVLGNAQSELGRGEDALVTYREALALDTEDAWTMNNYALQLIRLGRFEEALPPLARAVEIAPQSALFQNNLGVALERSGDAAAAAAAYTAALAVDSTHERARLSLERVSQQAGSDEPPFTDLSALALGFVSEMERWRTPPMEAIGVR